MRMQELEEAVAELETEKRKLQMENNSLKTKFGNLSQENVILKEKLGQKEGDCESPQSEKCDPPESAVLNRPQQQEQGRTLCLAASQYLAFILTMRSVYTYI
jgi:predicted nuclease with TOPRIM domain